MVGIMNGGWREKAASLTNSAKYAMEIPSKLEHLRQLKEILMQRDPSLLSELVPQLFEFQADRSSPVRKFLAEMIGEIGLKHMDYVPEIVPVLMALFKDDAPAVARQAIASGTAIFRCTLERVAIQGLSTSKLDDILESSWAWMLKLKDTVYSIAFQPGNDGMRLLAVKFVEAIVLLYTPDPNGYSEPPPNHAFDGQLAGFNITWLRGGHPVLNVTDLSIEASQSLGLLLDQLRFPAVKSLSNPFIIVLINSVSSIAKKRPAFYGRILPVLLGLYPSCSLIEGVQGPGVHHALKNAFLSCFKCTHPGAVPWRDRLVGALEEMKAGGLAEQAIRQVDNSKGSLDGREEEQKPSVKACDATSIDPRRKRSMVQDINDVVQDDDVSGKRARPTLSSEASTKDIHKDTDIIQDSFPSTGLTTSGDEGDTGPVQQLVAMFGALVAQGDKAAKSLEILISSISAELLAEVVIANLRYLPPDRPKAEEDQEPNLNMGSCSSMDGGDSLVKQMPSFLSHLLSLSSAFPQITSLIDDQRSVSLDGSDTQRKDRHQAAPEAESSLVCASVNDVTQAVVSSPSEMEKGTLAIPSDVHIMGNLEGQIPGLESTTSSSGLPNALETSHLSFVDLEGLNQEQVSSLSVKSQPDVLPFGSMSIDKSEERSPKVSVADTCSTISMTPYILPKISAPVINLSDEQKDQLQKLVFLRIIEAYKQITVAGGSDFRFSLLAYLAVEYPLELDPWKLLQKHILSDYSNHEGHELTVRVLYRLFGEAEEEQDFFSSTTATSVYETFLLTVAETLRDSFPASDKSLSRLFGEAPYLPKAAFRLLECLCCPGDKAKIEKELQSGDRVTQGLSAVWSLILLRPPIRDACLKIALQSAVHPLEEVRMKAIRLVANKLYPISSIAQQIEDYANEMLLSVLNGVCAREGMDMEGSTVELPKDSDLEKPSNENTLVNTSTKEISSDNQSGSVQSTSSSSISEAQRCTSLYFALCTKKHSLFRQIFVIYKSIPTAVKQVVHRHIPVLVRTIGASSDLLGIISDPPTGSEGLLLQVIHTLTDGATPSPEIIYAVRRLYDLKLKDVEVLIPVLSFLPKDEVLQIFPQLVNLPQDRFQVALARILQGLPHSDQVVSPTEVLIAIHGIDPDKDGIPLKKVTDACNACFEQREVFTQQVLAKVLNQLVEQIPLPLLFMRTVLQAIGAFPALVDFIMEILSRLVSKQIWKYPKLWVGFLKCALLTKPQSFSVLLQLPAPQLENALNRTAALKAPLIAHANQPNIRSTLPRSTLVVLGISPDSQTSSQAQTTQAVTEDAINSGTEVSTEKAKESSNAS